MENENIKLNNKRTLDIALLWIESTCKIKCVLKHKGTILILSYSQTHFYYCSSYTKGYSLNGVLNYRDYGSGNIKGKTWESHQFVCQLLFNTVCEVLPGSRCRKEKGKKILFLETLCHDG